MIVEAAFGFTKLPLVIKDVPWNDLGWESKTLGSINPLGQIPHSCTAGWQCDD